MVAAEPYRVRQWREREQEILRVATDVLMERGYRDTSMDDIAGQMGLSKGTLYHHFPSKDVLMLALFEGRLSSLLETLRQIQSEATSPSAALAAALRVAGDMAGPPVLAVREQPTIRALMTEISGVLSTIIDAGKTQGIFAHGIDTAIAVRALYALVTSHAYRTILGNGAVTEERLLDTLAQLYLGGLTAPAPLPMALPNATGTEVARR